MEVKGLSSDRYESSLLSPHHFKYSVSAQVACSPDWLENKVWEFLPDKYDRPLLVTIFALF